MSRKAPSPSANDAFTALISAFPIEGTTRGLIDIRRAKADTATLMFRWPPEARLYGVPLSLTALDRRLDWDVPAADLADWVDSVDLWILEDVDNEMRTSGRRRAAEDYIELTRPLWPSDDRFYVQVNSRLDTETTLLEEMARTGLDPRGVLAAQGADTLLAWTFAYENNSTGSPIVGHSTLLRDPSVDAGPARQGTRTRGVHDSHDLDAEVYSRGGVGIPRLVDVELSKHVPPTVALELVRAATHLAAGMGAEAVHVTETVAGTLNRLHPDLATIAGLVSGDGGYLVDTDFLAERPDLADQLLAEVLAEPGQWGQDRDREGRYIPAGRIGRLLHRLRHGESGTPPRMYAG